MSTLLHRGLAAWLTAPQIEVFGWTLVHFLWQGAVVALALAATLRGLKRSTPNSRYLAACAAMLLMALCPVVTLARLSRDTGNAVALSPSIGANVANPLAPDGGSMATSEAASPFAADSRDQVANQVGAAASTTTLAAKPQTAVRIMLPWAVAAWLVGVTVLSLRLCAGWISMLRLRSRTQPVPPAWELALRRLAERVRVSRPVRLVESALVETPSMIGWLRPMILLPASSLTGLTARELEALIAHELAHVRRHDYLVNLLQTALETLLFYHPATWWTSRIIRAEREACCDDIAAAACGDRLEYARALARMEELRPRIPRLALAATSGSLVDRIRRLVGAPAPQANRSAWWMLAALAAIAVATGAISSSDSVIAQETTANDWGPESNGLRCRIVPISPETDDEQPKLTASVTSFATSDDVTLGVELKNVGDKPVTLLGVRYGDSYATAKGKLNTDSMAPHLFKLEFADKAGNPIKRPLREFIDEAIHISSTSLHELAPGESLVVALRPAKFGYNTAYHLAPGDYRVRVRYRGLGERARDRLQKLGTDKPVLRGWSGDAISNETAFSVAAESSTSAALNWGETVDGLRAAVVLTPRGNAAAPDDPPGTVPLNSAVDATLHIENVSDAPISFSTETWRQDDQVTVTNDAGEPRDLSGTWYSGWAVMMRWTLEPGEIAEISGIGLAVVADESGAKTMEHPVGRVLNAIPGRYTVHYTLRMGGIQMRDGQGNVLVPGPNDWKGTLVTGETPLVVRARTPADDERAKANHFTGQIKFVGSDGTSISEGSFTVRTATQQVKPAPIAIHEGPIEIPDCTPAPVTISVRAAGYEEAAFHDIPLKSGETKRLELKRAVPARLRLISAIDRQPVANAKVRFFNRTSDQASNGPFPTDGIEGPVWATSAADGAVVLDTLQQVNPSYESLGDAVYFFYVEAPGLPGTFIGGVKAGQDLGDIVIGPELEVRGEIRGTPEELDRFDAEWDQPFEQKTAKSNFQYAVSQRLQTQRDGDKLSFTLTGLRPGKLRFIMSFASRPHSVSHAYGRRDPKGSDVLVEVELTESVNDLVLTPKGRE